MILLLIDWLIGVLETEQKGLLTELHPQSSIFSLRQNLAESLSCIGWALIHNRSDLPFQRDGITGMYLSAS